MFIFFWWILYKSQTNYNNILKWSKINLIRRSLTCHRAKLRNVTSDWGTTSLHSNCLQYRNETSCHRKDNIAISSNGQATDYTSVLTSHWTLLTWLTTNKQSVKRFLADVTDFKNCETRIYENAKTKFLTVIPRIHSNEFFPLKMAFS